MALRLWLPLNGSLVNQGLDDYEITTLGTISWVNGKIGKALSAGTASRTPNGVSINSNLTDVLSNDYSVAVWVKPLGDHVHYNGTILSSGDWNRTRWAFGLSQDNTKVDVLSNGYNVFLDCPIPVNEWTHICCVRTSNELVSLYKNGEYVNSLHRDDHPLSDTANTTVGRETYADGYFSFNGNINDLRLYDHALSLREIKELSKGLILHYPLNRGGFGQDNLSTNSGDLTLWNKESGITCVWDDTQQMFKIDTTTRTSSRWGIYQDITCEPNTIYTFSVDGKKVEKTMYLSVGSYASGSVRWPANHQQFTNKRQRLSYTFTTGDNHTVIRIYLAVYPTSEGSNAAYYALPKLEKGSTPTPWIPNSADALYSAMGLDDGIEYDVSGYGNNGEWYTYDDGGSVECSSDTPRYNVSTHISSANPNADAAAGTRYLYGHCSITNPTEMTVAFWCKPIQGYGGGIDQGQFCTTNYEYGNVRAGSDYQASAMNHRDGTVDINDSASTTQCRVYIAFTANEWHHYAITYDGQTGRSYKDGVLKDTKSFSSALALDSFIGVIIGFSKAGGVWRRNNSYYSDFRLYTTALSADDILALYNTPVSIANNGTLLTHGEISEV